MEMMSRTSGNYLYFVVSLAGCTSGTIFCLGRACNAMDKYTSYQSILLSYIHSHGPLKFSHNTLPRWPATRKVSPAAQGHQGK